MRGNVQLIRKEIPVPGPKPPSRPAPQGDIRTPGGEVPSQGGMICPGTGRQ